MHTPVPGGWCERELKIAERTFKLVLPAQPDEFLEELSTLPREQHDDHDVYWRNSGKLHLLQLRGF